MKKLFFLFLFLFPLWGVGGLFASVTVTPLSIDYANKKVTFHVAWTGAVTNNRVWVWIDLCPITGTSPGTFAKAVISGATATAGSMETVAGNTRGFYVTTNPSTVTATLSTASGKFNWCVYGSDAPPNVTAANGTYTLHGSPPFILTAADGTTTQTVATTAIATSAVTVTPVTLTDQTGYPGVFCIYTGSDLYIDGTHLCQTRAGGAQNWEAYIQDTRDSQIYRITQFSDNSWWFADDFNLDVNVKTTCNGKRYYAILDYPACPDGWSIPTLELLRGRWACPPTDDLYGAAIEKGVAPGAGTNPCSARDGWDILATGYGVKIPSCCLNTTCGQWNSNLYEGIWGRMRCRRSL